MLKLIVQIQCDECGELFHIARASLCTADALGFNTRTLTAMLPEFHWRLCTSEKTRYHYCPNCSLYFDDMELMFCGNPKPRP